MRISIFQKSLFVSFYFFLVLLTACGGSSSVPVNQPPTANAGIDQSVEENTVVDLNPVVADGDGEVTQIAWDQISGPSVSLEAVDVQSGHFRVMTPDTGVETSIELVFELSVTDDDGATTTDQIAITVTRVNDAPAVNAGNDLSVEGLTEVVLNGSGADIDGDVISYLWEQTAGQQVVISNANQASAGFSAPSTNVDLQLTFALTVTDNEGATTSDSVTFTITPENAPLISITFPPERGGYDGETIAAFGIVEARGGSTISSVNVSAGAGSVAANVAPDGSWRAENIAIPEGVETFTLMATATDSAALQNEAEAQLATSTVSIGSGANWEDLAALSLDVDNGRAWIMTVGSLARDVQFIPVDLQTGIRGVSVTDITNEEQGPTDSANVDMVYNRMDGYLYYSISPAEQTLSPKIIRINTQTGMRELVSSAELGTGMNFDHPVSIDAGPNGTLYVADYVLNSIISVDIASGNRSVLADTSSTTVPIEFPLIIDWDDFISDRLYVTPNWSDAIELYYVDLNDQSTHAVGLYSPHSSNARSVYGFALDQDVLEAWYLTFSGSIIHVKPEDNTGTEIDFGFPANALGNIYRGLDYDQTTNLLYAITEGNALYVIDIPSRSAVVLSQN